MNCKKQRISSFPCISRKTNKKKLSTANMVTTYSTMTKTENMHSIKLLYIKLSSKQQVFCTQIFVPMEKHDRYVLYVLDKYKNKVHIIDPREMTHEEIEKEKPFSYFCHSYLLVIFKREINAELRRAPLRNAKYSSEIK